MGTRLGRIAAVGFASVVVAALVLAGGKPWKDKPYTEWTEQDTARILQNSPWAKVMFNVGGTAQLHGNTNLDSGSVVGEGNGGSFGGAGRVSGAPQGNSTGSGGSINAPSAIGAVLPAEHETSLNDPRAPKTYVVVWWSARTTREAVERREVAKGLQTEEQAKQALAVAPGDYQVMVEGPNLSIFDQRTPESFKRTTFLQMKSTKAKAYASSVQYLRKSDGRVSAVIFHFAKKDKTGEPIINPDEKQIAFYCHVGDGQIVTGFDPREMEDNQGMDL